MAHLNDSILSLQEKLQVLLKRFVQLEKENQQLKAALAQQKESTQLVEQQMKDEQAQWAASMVNKANMDPAEKEKWVKKIDQYIKEIDASIKNLNP
jgi:dsDNA-specific endonuclease/ATPase MutS2